jgi:hypothetical protein
MAEKPAIISSIPSRARPRRTVALEEARAIAYEAWANALNQRMGQAIEVLFDKAIEGDVNALKLVIERLVPVRKSAPKDSGAGPVRITIHTAVPQAPSNGGDPDHGGQPSVNISVSDAKPPIKRGTTVDAIKE